MVKKSEADRSRADFFRRQMLRRNALNGPFICPKCNRDKKLVCRIGRRVVKEKYTTVTGKKRTRKVKLLDFLFTCGVCGFRRLITGSERSVLIDVYNRLYDEEVSPVLVEEHHRRIEVRIGAHVKG